MSRTGFVLVDGPATWEALKTVAGAVDALADACPNGKWFLLWFTGRYPPQEGWAEAPALEFSLNDSEERTPVEPAYLSELMRVSSWVDAETGFSLWPEPPAQCNPNYLWSHAPLRFDWIGKWRVFTSLDWTVPILLQNGFQMDPMEDPDWLGE